MTLDLTKVIPATTIAHLTCGDVEISPIRLRQLKPLLDAVAAINGDFVSVEELDQLDAAGWIELVRTSGDSLMPVLAILTGLTVEQLGELMLDDVLELAAVAIEVNSAFFFEKFGPALTRTIERVSALAGPMSSSS